MKNMLLIAGLFIVSTNCMGATDGTGGAEPDPHARECSIGALGYSDVMGADFPPPPLGDSGTGPFLTSNVTADQQAKFWINFNFNPPHCFSSDFDSSKDIATRVLLIEAVFKAGKKFEMTITSPKDGDDWHHTSLIQAVLYYIKEKMKEDPFSLRNYACEQCWQQFVNGGFLPGKFCYPKGDAK